MKILLSFELFWRDTYEIFPKRFSIIENVYQNQIHKLFPINIHVEQANVDSVIEENFNQGEIGRN